jgi:preprotein translocase subunit YajC
MEQYSTLIFIALLVAAFYFLILRPQRKRQQAMRETMNAISPGDRVMLASGLFGTVVTVGPQQVVLEISPGAELTVLKQAISKIVTPADEDNLEDDDELDELDTANAADSSTEEPRLIQPERPVEQPPAATSTDTGVEPDTTATRDSKPSTD